MDQNSQVFKIMTYILLKVLTKIYLFNKGKKTHLKLMLKEKIIIEYLSKILNSCDIINNKI